MRVVPLPVKKPTLPLMARELAVAEQRLDVGGGLGRAEQQVGGLRHQPLELGPAARLLSQELG